MSYVGITADYYENKSNNMKTSTGVKSRLRLMLKRPYVQGGSNMTGTDLCVNKPHCAAAVRP